VLAITKLATVCRLKIVSESIRVITFSGNRTHKWIIESYTSSVVSDSLDDIPEGKHKT